MKKLYKFYFLIYFLVVGLNLNFAQTEPPIQVLPLDNSNYQKARNLVLTWNAVPDIYVYQCQYGTDTTFISPEGDYSVSGNSLMISELQNNTVYYWRVRTNAQGAQWSETWNFKTTGLPTTPKPFFPLNNIINQSDSLTLAWSKDSVNSSYKIELSFLSDFSVNEATIAATDSFVNVYYLDLGKTYYWRIKGINVDYDESSWSEVFNFRTRLVTPYQLSPGNNSTNLDTNITLTWSQIESAQKYRVQFGLNKSLTQDSILLDKELTVNSIKLPSLLYTTNYYWKIIAYNSDGDSSLWTNTYKFRTKLASPDLFSPADTFKNADSVLTFTWSGVPNATKYQYQLSANKNFSTYVFNDTLKTNSVKIDSLDFNRYYYWRVAAKNSLKDTSNWSDVRFFKTRLTSPLLISPVDSLKNMDTVLTFKWSPVDSAKSYHLQLSRSANFESSQLFADTILAKTSIKIDSLPVYTKFYWRVYANNDNKDSSRWSNVFYLKTRLAGIQIKLPKDSLINTDTAMVFQWNAITGATKYRFQLSGNSVFTELVADDSVKTNQYSIDSLFYYKKYFWRVLGKNELGDSSRWTSFRNFKTRLLTPALYSPEDKIKNAPTTVYFYWQPIDGATKYKIQLSNESNFFYPEIDTAINRTSYRADDLTLDTLYYWRIIALNALNDSSLWTKTFSFKTRPAILIEKDSVKTSLNLYTSLSDTLGFFTVSNAGVNQFVIDSIYVRPDSVYIVQERNAVIGPKSQKDFLIRINTAKAPIAYTYGSITLIRINGPKDRDTLKTDLNFYLRKAVAKVTSDSLMFLNTAASRKSTKQIIIYNDGGNVPLAIKKIKVEGTDTTTFRVINPPKSVDPNSSTAITVEFSPQKFGVNQTTLTVETNAYPKRNLSFWLEGNGRGGELAVATFSYINTVAKDSFETFTSNNKQILFHNIGNEPLNIAISFPNNNFKLTNDLLNSFSLKVNDTISVYLKYLTPVFNKQAKDTLVIIHNGFGQDTIRTLLKGYFDSTQSANKVLNNLRLNSEPFLSTPKIFFKNTPLNLKLNSDLFANQGKLNFRLAYYNGGNGKRLYKYHDGNFNYFIPGENVTQNGLIVFGELYSVDKNGKIADSILVFDSLDVQVILSDFQTKEISVPRSRAAENADNANVKWIPFGFPMGEIVADSVFKFFGGIKNMKDGEWVVYKYDPTAADSFSIFNDYYLSPETGYFIAQSLLDSFKISYKYPGNIRTKKLTENQMNLTGSNWKLISSPFLFDVEIDSDIPLYHYDVNTKNYKTTYIMKPYEAYFAEPTVNRLRLKTFDKYNPAIYPKAIADNGWHLNLKVTDNESENDLMFSTKNKNISKLNSTDKNEYLQPAGFGNSLESFIVGEDSESRCIASVKGGTNGAEWDFVLLNNSGNSEVNLNAAIAGKIPQNYSYKIFDCTSRKVIDENSFLRISKGSEHQFKMLIGTGEFINESLNKLKELNEITFALEQNYPNPFNPATTIKYSIPYVGANSSSPVQLKLFDILGKEVVTLVNEQKQPGYYTISFDASQFASGVYIYQLKAGSLITSKKMILLK